MKELALVSQTTPAVVSFNYAEIDKQLDDVLKKYGGLLFTDETVTECKKTIAELKKGKKSLNDFKIKTKKLLTEDITKFENQCKLLSDKFDTVINPISEQAEEFEVKRIEEKRIAIQSIIDVLIIDRNLGLKYYEPLVITDAMLNKGTTMKSITADLTKQADVLLSQQNMEKANIELIKSKVELANAQYGVTLPVGMYLRMLEYSNVTEINKLIIDDAEKTKIAAEKAELERLAIEARKAERLAKIEADRIALELKKEADRLESERINQEKQARLAEEKAKSVVAPAPVSKPITATEILAQIPPLKIVIPQVLNIETEVFVETYIVDGTEAELNALEDYLNANNYTWRVKSE